MLLGFLLVRLSFPSHLERSSKERICDSRGSRGSRFQTLVSLAAPERSDRLGVQIDPELAESDSPKDHNAIGAVYDDAKLRVETGPHAV